MAARAGVAAAVYVSLEVYSLPVYQDFASLRPPLCGRTRLVIIIIIIVYFIFEHISPWVNSILGLHDTLQLTSCVVLRPAELFRALGVFIT